MAKKKIKVTLKKSTIGSRKDQIATVRSLGLKRLNSSIILEDIPQVRGMIRKVSHLLEVEEV